MTIPLNQIFYGPPGTGKTYSVSIEAEKIVNLKQSQNIELNLVDIYDRILKIIRTKYSTEEYKAKSNSIYRNDRAIMRILGFFLDDNLEFPNHLTRSEALENGLPQTSSTWSQYSQFISQFKLVNNWRNTTNLELNEEGISLKNIAKNNYDKDELKKWDKDCPIEIRDFYSEILVNQNIDDFTPMLKTFFCALNMLVNGDLYKQDNEQRPATDEEKEIAKRYFDLKPNITDLKWIGHFGRILQGLGITKLNRSLVNGKNFYEPTEYGGDLLKKISLNWIETYPDLFQQSISYDAAVKLGLTHFITFHQSYSYEEFIEGIRPNLNDSDNLSYELVDGIFKGICDKAKHDLSHNYVIIIDEINRGNISKIFGELITLIEPSKRLYSTPKENPQSVTLPFSKSIFSVPNNLYIIGTMNTADRSITSIDTALRRRFSFKGFPPKPSLLSNIVITQNANQIDLVKILSVMNNRIEYLLDKDHLIGHSYFLKVKNWDDLCEVFRDNIIPLLQEYFYNDWDKIALVLGDTESFGKTDDEKLIIKTKFQSEKLFKRDYSGEDIDIYQINEELLKENYQKISENFFIKGF
ncbi:MAG: AAA family ATPase [Polynucleobacter sp.]|nr:AAA family ATPase [Polynucleobacter sp.]